MKDIKKLNVYNCLISIAILGAFLPYLKISSFETDIQPHSLIILTSFALIANLRKIYLKDIFLLLYALMCSLVVFLLSAQFKDAFAVIFIVSTIIAVSKSNPEEQKIIVKCLNILVYVYATGLIIEILQPHVLEVLVSNNRSSAERGFSSFAPEPSFLGFVGLVLYFSLLLLEQRERRFVRLLALILVIFSGSMAAIIPAFLIISLNFASKLSIRNILTGFLAILMISFGTVIYSEKYPDTRFSRVANLVISESTIILQIDESIANRFLRGLGPTIYSINNKLLPNNIDELEKVKANIGVSLHPLAAIERISNLSGILFFYLGFLGMPLLYIYMRKMLRLDNKYMISKIVFSGSLMVSLLAPLTPYLCVALGLIVLNQKSK